MHHGTEHQALLFFKEVSNVTLCCTECDVRTAMTPWLFFAPFVQTEAGRISLEGCLCEDYYKIRELLYQQYAVV